MESVSEKLVYISCSKCKKNFIPPKYVCPGCGDERFEERVSCGEGTIYSVTTIRVPPLGFEKEVPYDVALIDLREGFRMTAVVKKEKREDIKINDKCFFLGGEAGKYYFWKA